MRLHKTLMIVVSFWLMTTPLAAQADASSPAQNWPCPVAQTVDSQDQPVYFTQVPIDQQWQELAVIAQQLKTRVIKRITYEQQTVEACHFKVVAIAQGGEWGWFLAWADRQHLYYTRMDSEALVFAPPKKLAISDVAHIAFIANQPHLSMQVQTQKGQMHVLVSDDEGRHWAAKEMLD